jgi:phosphatidylglycerophosphate synthase
VLAVKAGLIQQYKQSLKVNEAEEVFDLIIFRPLAFLFVKAVYRTKLTPNMVSIIAMTFGVLAGILFGYGTYSLLIPGAVLYGFCNILDCADGMIARLKHTGTKVGRIVDGFLDYVVSTAVFAGFGAGLSHLYSTHHVIFTGNLLNLNPYLYAWLLALIAGISSAYQAFYFDYYRNLFLEFAYGKVSSLEEEIKEFEEEKVRLESDKQERHLVNRFLIAIYLRYCRFQLKIQAKKKENPDWAKPVSADYYSKNKLLLRVWSFIGSTTHITTCIICVLADRMELFLWICILPLNILLLLLYFIQTRVNNKLIYHSNPPQGV